jgi:tRNA-splicing ligase RtcB
MRFEFISERATKIVFSKIPIKFIGTEAIQDSFEKDVYEQALRVANLPHISHLAFMPDAHVGIGTCIGTMAAWKKDKALISPSICGVDIGCGMRLVRTPIKASDLNRTLLQNLMNEIEKRIPMGVGKKVKNELSQVKTLASGNLDSVISLGNERFGEFVPGSYSLIESIGTEVSTRAWQRGFETLGTLGGGNHFIEIQKVQILDTVAEQWGLFQDQLVIEIHSGSRGFGHQIAEEYIKKFGKLMDTQGISREDKGLVYAPLKHTEAAAYLKAQKAACNFSVSNRLIMSRHVHQALQEVIGSREGVSDLCDIIHNYIVEEGDYIIHRKGATAAYPAHHKMLEGSKFFETGFPVLIPGSMGTASYILQPTQNARDTLFTVNHGAGRVMSRRQARKEITTNSFRQQMSRILVNERDLKKLKDEAPEAYKDIDQVIKSVEKAGLAKVVARCTPLAVMKGE